MNRAEYVIVTYAYYRCIYKYIYNYNDHPSIWAYKSPKNTKILNNSVIYKTFGFLLDLIVR